MESIGFAVLYAGEWVMKVWIKDGMDLYCVEVLEDGLVQVEHGRRKRKTAAVLCLCSFLFACLCSVFSLQGMYIVSNLLSAGTLAYLLTQMMASDRVKEEICDILRNGRYLDISLRNGEYLDISLRAGVLVLTVETKERVVQYVTAPLTVREKVGIPRAELDVSRMVLYLPYQKPEREGVM